MRERTMKILNFILAVFLITGFSCHKNEKEVQLTPPGSMYFPPNNSTQWETQSLTALGWNPNAIQPLKDYLVATHAKSFMILVNGRIVMEEYMNGHSAATSWEWNSAGKTLVSSSMGIAEQEGLLGINDSVSKYLGMGWTSETPNKEKLITLRHLLTMTSGLNDSKEFVSVANLTYLADAGTRWSYHNVFQKLMDVISIAGSQDFDSFFTDRIKNKIGMDGYWNHGLIYTIYHSTTRSMARFGLLALNKGKWNDEQIINEDYFNDAISTSQNLNPSYGYLWWLNGKSSYRVPGSQTVFQGSMIANAPSGMYSAMGANDQRIYVIPSKKMVVVRMGDPSDPQNPSFALSGFDQALWEKINNLIDTGNE